MKNKTTTTLERNGDIMRQTTVEEFPAVINFSDILDSVKSEYDEDSNIFKYDEYYAHTLASTSSIDCTYSQEQEVKGAASYHCGSWREPSGLITLDHPATPEEYRGAYRNVPGMKETSGMSKGVAFEMAALENKRRVASIKSILCGNGSQAYWIRIDFMGFEDSLSGIFDDYPYTYLDECKRDMAIECSLQLTKQGYTVQDVPAPKDQSVARRAQIREQFKRQLTSDCWKD